MTLRLNGSTSGYTEIDAPAVAGNNTLVLPTTTNGSLVALDSSGRLLVGTSSSSAVGGYNGLIQLKQTSDACALSLLSEFNSAFGSYLTLGKSRGTNGLVNSNDTLGEILFAGGNGSNVNANGAAITCGVDGTPLSTSMPGRLVFSTTAAGASSPTERMRISGNGAVRIPFIYTDTTASASNVVVLSDGYLLRSTSSAKYKTNVETLADQFADAILGCRPVWYKSLCNKDNSDWGYWGFIAEEVAQVDPRLCFFKEKEDGTLEPEGVQYDRFVPHLLNLIKRQGEAIADLQAEVAALKGA